VVVGGEVVEGCRRGSGGSGDAIEGWDVEAGADGGDVEAGAGGGRCPTAGCGGGGPGFGGGGKCEVEPTK
jgi:hypothetical protein